MTALSSPDAVDLATAWAGFRAERAGVRLLVIKGPAAHEQGLRPARQSADVDVLVDPEGVQGFIDGCLEAGWYIRPAFSAPRLVELHSTTLSHPGWPIDIDVHHYWPGFLGDRAEHFELLWSRSVPRTVCQSEVRVPDVLSMSLILALHGLRRPRVSQAREGVAALADALGRLGLPDAPRQVHELARWFGADQTARPFLEALGLDVPEESQPSPELIRWRMNAASKGYTDAWLVSLAAAPLRAKAGVLWAALHPSAEELRIRHPEIPPGRVGIARARLVRIGNGLRELPRSARNVVSQKAEHSSPRGSG